MRYVVGGLLACTLLLVPLSCTTVPAGHVGVVTSFGRIDPQTLDAGLHWLAPWKRVKEMSVRTVEVKETADVPTKEGLTVQLEASLLLSLDKSRAVDVFRTVGPDYVNVVVESQFRSAMRAATVLHTAKDLYTAGRAEIESSLEAATREALASRGVLCEKVMLRSITLPDKVRAAIEAKLAADQDAQRMAFVIQKETQEAERKRVEARGIADAQHIIQKTLEPNYLRYLWIEALKVAAEHKTATIYIPTGADGMPVVKTIDAQGK